MIAFWTVKKIQHAPNAQHEGNQCADDLGDELPDVAEEQAFGDGAAVVHRAIGEQAERQLTPHTVDAVDRDRANRIVDLEAVEEWHSQADQQAGDGADDEAVEWD